MNTQQRALMLQRYDAANRWLTRVYDHSRSDQHRIGMWNFLMDTADPRLKQIILTTREMDEMLSNYWNNVGKN